MSSIAEHLASIERSLTMAKAENEKLAKGCKASAPKVRNALLDIGKTCSDSRKAEQPDAVPVLECQDAVADLAAPAKKLRARKPKAAPVAPPALEEAK